MSITVENFKNKFQTVPTFVIARLVGKANYKISDVIPLSNLAASNNNDFYKFAYKNSGASFLEYFNGSKRQSVSQIVNHNPAGRKQNSVFSTRPNNGLNNTPLGESKAKSSTMENSLFQKKQMIA